MLSVLQDEDIKKESWDKLIAISSVASWFQSHVCYNFYKQLSFLSPFVYGVEEEGTLKALVCGYLISEKGLVKSFFSRRAIIPGGVLIANDVSDTALEMLLLKVKTDLLRKAIYIEFRNLHDYSAYKHIFQRMGFVYQAHLNFQLALTNVDDVFLKFSDSRRRQIKQSYKEGVNYEQTVNIQDIKDFYLILQAVYNQKIKLPLFPVEFFEELVTNSYGQLFVVKKENKVLGGIVCVGDKNSMYEWFVCGLDEENLRLYPSVMATWAAIEFATQNSFNTFDFMGAGKPNEKYGVRDFKARFGGTLVEHGRFLYICSPLLYFTGKIIIALR